MNPTTAIENLLRHLSFALPVYFTALIIIETLILLYKYKKGFGRENKVNLISGAVTIIVQAVLKTFLLTGIYPAVYEHRLFDLGWGWAAWIAGFFLYTFIQYGTHYLYHKVRLFWCLHEVHHSATHMDTTTGLRTSVFDVVSLDLCYLLIPFLGIDPLVYFVLYTLNKFWGAFIHVNEKIISHIPFLHYILVTPQAHHLHHASNEPYLDKNFGEIIPWFDRIFGTYVTQKEKPVFGTVKVKSELGFWDTHLHEWKSLWRDMVSTPRLRHKLAYVFMPPGWKPS
jgi:sterol desaturase/sphingolipid hydroxylase (fatty acid hydroxylase superfamily)